MTPKVRLPDATDRVCLALFGKTLGLRLCELGPLCEEGRPWRFTNAIVGQLWRRGNVVFTTRKRVILRRMP